MARLQKISSNGRFLLAYQQAGRVIVKSCADSMNPFISNIRRLIWYLSQHLDMDPWAVRLGATDASSWNKINVGFDLITCNSTKVNCTLVVQSRVVELDVVMHCEGCAAGVRRAVRKIPGKIIWTFSRLLDFRHESVGIGLRNYPAIVLDKRWSVIIQRPVRK